MKRKLFSLWLKLHHKHICEEEVCLKEAIQCHILDYGDFTKPPVDVISWYCPEHAGINGFCYMCGEFWTGNTEFDMDPSHLCCNCRYEVDAETVEVDGDYAAFFD